MTPSRAIGLGSLCLALCAFAAPPVPEVSQTTHYYTFDGTTVAEMLAQLAKRAPKTDDGNFHALTKWFVKWRYDYDRRDGTCGIGPVKVTVTVDVQLPKWSRPAGASSRLVAKWDAYATALRTHENGHKEIGIEAARSVAKALAAVPRQTSCEQLESVADAAGERILEITRVTERDYDQRTRHGATQGALFR